MRSSLLRYLILLSIFFCWHGSLKARATQQSITYEVKMPVVVMSGIPQTVSIVLPPDSTNTLESPIVTINDQPIEYDRDDNTLLITYTFSQQQEMLLSVDNNKQSIPIHPVPLWLSVLPPLLAILFALLFKEVYSALLLGIWSGTLIIYAYQGNGFLLAVGKSFLAIIDTYIITALNDRGHLSIILFSMIIAATVSVITRNGGMRGVVLHLSKYAKGPRSAAFITWLMGILIFFDDYANTLVVGNTMRPLTDRMKISREKLAYIIDSTAAPMASIAFVTTWIGAELSYIQDGINHLNLDESAYGVFFQSLAYSFYPLFALLFIVMLIIRNVDYGPMWNAEQKARALTDIEQSAQIIAQGMHEEIEVKEGIKVRAMNAIIPVVIIVAGTLGGLLYTGYTPSIWNNTELSFIDKLSDTIGGSNSYLSLLWASSASLFTAILLSLVQRTLNLKESVESIVHGFKTMLPAIMILTLAWSIALLTEHLHTASFISKTLIDGSFSPMLLPALTFVMAALISFSTGSSWGTMAILYPLILPSGWLLFEHAGLDYSSSMSLFHNMAAAVLTGSVFGDHCSPISDTTILSSLASSCPHIEHVRTQLPYALTTGSAAVLIGTIPASYGISPWFLFPAGLIFLWLIIIKWGKPVGVSTKLFAKKS